MFWFHDEAVILLCVIIEKTQSRRQHALWMLSLANRTNEFAIIVTLLIILKVKTLLIIFLNQNSYVKIIMLNIGCYVNCKLEYTGIYTE